jgi:hypothetical protein
VFVEVTTRKGEVVRFVHPGIRIMQSERDAAMHYLRQLGTTPKTRGELRRIGSEGATVDLDSFLGFGGGRRAGNGASPTRGRGRRPSLSGSTAVRLRGAPPAPRRPLRAPAWSRRSCSTWTVRDRSHPGAGL